MPKPRVEAWLLLLGCIIVGGLFWVLGGGYRAVAPLVFIFGLIGFFLCCKGKILSLRKPHMADPSDLRKYLETRRVDQQKKILWEQDIPALIAGLYFKHIQHYPKWRSDSPEIVPTVVTAAVVTKQGYLRTIIYLNEYEFRFKENGAQGLLELYAGTHKSFGLFVAKEKGKYGERWTAQDMEMFTVGQWLTDFKNLGEETLKIIRDRARDSQEN